MKGLSTRATEVFAAQRDAAKGELKAMHARHAAKGLLQSGATAKEGIRIAEEASAAALDQLHAEVAKILEQRGRRWTRAMTTIETALDSFTGTWREWLDPTFRLARAQDGAAGAAVAERLGAAAVTVQRRHAAFRDGWTAPRGKPWRERHPVLWGAAVALAGALLGQAVPAAWKALFPASNAAPAKPPD